MRKGFRPSILKTPFLVQTEKLDFSALDGRAGPDMGHGIRFYVDCYEAICTQFLSYIGTRVAICPGRDLFRCQLQSHTSL